MSILCISRTTDSCFKVASITLTAALAGLKPKNIAAVEVGNSFDGSQVCHTYLEQDYALCSECDDELSPHVNADSKIICLCESCRNAGGGTCNEISCVSLNGNFSNGSAKNSRAILYTVHEKNVRDIYTSADKNILMSLQGIGGIGAKNFCLAHQQNQLPKDLDALKFIGNLHLRQRLQVRAGLVQRYFPYRARTWHCGCQSFLRLLQRPHSNTVANLQRQSCFLLLPLRLNMSRAFSGTLSHFINIPLHSG